MLSDNLRFWRLATLDGKSVIGLYHTLLYIYMYMYNEIFCCALLCIILFVVELFKSVLSLQQYAAISCILYSNEQAVIMCVGCALIVPY